MDVEEKAKFEGQLRTSDVAKKLAELIDGFTKELTVNRNDYDNPSWAYKQADYNGELRAYTKILQLLRPKEQNG